MTAGTGPTRDLGSGYLNQRAYQADDTLPCCGCPLSYGPEMRACDCACHETARVIFGPVVS